MGEVNLAAHLVMNQKREFIIVNQTIVLVLMVIIKVIQNLNLVLNAFILAKFVNNMEIYYVNNVTKINFENRSIKLELVYVKINFMTMDPNKNVFHAYSIVKRALMEKLVIVVQNQEICHKINANALKIS
jgi:hypothetical protein